MNVPSHPTAAVKPKIRRPLTVLMVLVLGAVTPGLAREELENTIVIARVHNGYTRSQRPDGTFEPESYAFAVGGMYEGQSVAGDPISSMAPHEVLRALTVPLARQGFAASTDPEATRLLLMVFWGSTRDTSGKDTVTAADLVEASNARILGFEREVAKARDLYFTSLARDVFEELRAGRYFVVIRAFDFQSVRRHKQYKLLWESRFSIRRQGVNFVRALPNMAALAGPTFGRQNSGRLEASVRDGKIQIGEQQVIEYLPAGVTNGVAP